MLSGRLKKMYSIILLQQAFRIPIRMHDEILKSFRAGPNRIPPLHRRHVNLCKSSTIIYFYAIMILVLVAVVVEVVTLE